MEELRRTRRARAARPSGLSGLCFAVLAALSLCAQYACADRLVLKTGKVVFGTITDERDSLIRYFDRFERPRRIAAGEVDTINYDAKDVRGAVKVAFRKGQPKDRSGYFRIRHSEELDLEVTYKTDSAAELDLFFRDNVHVRVLPGTQFKIIKAPKSPKDPLVLELHSGRILATSGQEEALVRIATPWGIAVGRGSFRAGVVSSSGDSSLQAMCLRGLVGVQETQESPGELVVDEGKSVSLFKKEGILNRKEPDETEERRFLVLAANMGRYRFSAIEYPKIGYLPKAITGLGFMVFFYGTAIGILDYVNHI
ncbi:MAG TPA: hypothetical protein VJ385_18980 [Fibrobacteria bacterium]|nr:hypothetical protein [Fibrobacteria bacterium]